MKTLGLIAELNANAEIPGKQLEAIMTAYPSAWGYAAPLKSGKTGQTSLKIAATRLPEGWSAKDIHDMKAQAGGMPEMMEIFQKFPDNVDEVCLQPFPVLEDDGGNVTLCLFMEGDYDIWADEAEPNLTGEYRCYRDKICPLIEKVSKLCGGDVSAIVKELQDPAWTDILQGTYENRGVMYFLANTGANYMIEGGNDKRKDEDWGGLSNEVPDIQVHTDTTVEEEIPAPAEKPELSLAEKRRLRQQNADKAAVKTIEGVHATTASPRPVIQKKDTTLAEQGIKESLNTSTAAPPKLPMLFTLPKTITDVDEAKKYWQTNFGTCPDMYKRKDDKGNWVPSYSAGFPYEKAAKGSIIREKFNPDGSLKSGSKGFAALDAVATGKEPSVPTAKGPDPDAARSAPPSSKIPVMPTAVRDKIITELEKLDLKSRPIMSNDDAKKAEEKHSTLFAQLKNMPVEHLWRMSHDEIDRLNRTFPDFGSVWLFSLRNYQIQNWKTAEEPKKEAGTEPAQVQPELTLAQKRAARKAAAA
jgi:hypothetical protein